MPKRTPAKDKCRAKPKRSRRTDSQPSTSRTIAKDETLSPFDMLPNQDLDRILSYFSSADRVALERVCHRWRESLLRSYTRRTQLTLPFDIQKDWQVQVPRKNHYVSYLTKCGESLIKLRMHIPQMMFGLQLVKSMMAKCRSLQAVEILADCNSRTIRNFIDTLTSLQEETNTKLQLFALRYRCTQYCGYNLNNSLSQLSDELLQTELFDLQVQHFPYKVERILPNNPRLTHLIISFTEHKFIKIGENWMVETMSALSAYQRLKTLFIALKGWIDVDRDVEIFKRMTALSPALKSFLFSAVSLNTTPNQFEYTFISAVALFRGLESLALLHCKIPDNFPWCLPPRLTKLELRHVRNLSLTGLLNICNAAPYLVHLDLEQDFWREGTVFHNTETLISIITACPFLTNVIMAWVANVDLKKIAITLAYCIHDSSSVIGIPSPPCDTFTLVLLGSFTFEQLEEAGTSLEDYGCCTDKITVDEHLTRVTFTTRRRCAHPQSGRNLLRRRERYYPVLNRYFIGIRLKYERLPKRPTRSSSCPPRMHV